MPKIKQGDGFKSKVTRAHSESDSLRTTIPDGVVDKMQIKAGDTLHWEPTSKSARVEKADEG